MEHAVSFAISCSWKVSSQKRSAVSYTPGMVSLWQWSNTAFSCHETHELLGLGRIFGGSTPLYLPCSYISFWPLSEMGSGQARPFIQPLLGFTSNTIRFYGLFRQAADFTTSLTPKGQGYLLPAPTEPCIQHGHICRGELHDGASASSKVLCYGVRLLLSVFQQAFLACRTVAHHLLMCEAPTVSDPWEARQEREDVVVLPIPLVLQEWFTRRKLNEWVFCFQGQRAGQQ